MTVAIPGKREPRVIGDYRRDARARLLNRDEVIAEEEARYARAAGDPELPKAVAERKVLEPYFPREPISAGDPLSPSGPLVAYEELDADLQDLVNQGGGGGGTGVRVRETDGAPDIDPTTIITVPNDTLTLGGPGEAVLDFNAFELREVLLGPFTALVTPGTAINIQTGVYAGAGSPAAVVGDVNVTLPSSGVAFKDDGRIEVHLNGQELTKGDGSGNGVAEWVSSTQIKVNIKVKNLDELMVRAPFPTA